MSLQDTLKIQEIIAENNPHSSSFIFRYLLPATGITTGNYLRRTLLTSLQGVALCGAAISDKNGSIKVIYSTLAGVRETVPYLIANLKKIVIEIKEKSSQEEIYCLEMDIKNPKNEEYIITAGDFPKNSAWEIKNPTLYLATLAPYSQLKIKLYFREDQGYYSAAEQKKYFVDNEKVEENIIVFDTDYSPIKSNETNFQINEVVTGLEKKEEELKLTITTNGCITPKKALLQALEIIDQTNQIIKNKLNE